MKVFTCDKVYVQIIDIFMLYHSSASVRSEIYDEAAKNTSMLDDDNRFNFISFDSKEIIDYFMRDELVFDYNKYKAKTVLELIAERKMILREIAALSKEEEKPAGVIDYKTYYLENLAYLTKIKKGKVRVPQQLVPESSYPEYLDNNYPYILACTNIRNIFILSRIDKESFAAKEGIPYMFIKRGISAITHFKTFPRFNLDISRSISEDGKQMILTVKKHD